MEKEFGTFRKATFGGFNRKDVISYIEKMKNETYEYKMQVEETVRNLNEKIFELENAVNLSDDAVSAPSASFSSESVGDIKDATVHLKSVADELCRSLSDFIDKLTRKGLCEGDADLQDESVFSDNVQTDKVSDILSVMSFLDGEGDCDNSVLPSEKTQDNSDSEVERILSVLSFLG